MICISVMAEIVHTEYHFLFIFGFVLVDHE